VAWVGEAKVQKVVTKLTKHSVKQRETMAVGRKMPSSPPLDLPLVVDIIND